jgi:hypothetical protein
MKFDPLTKAIYTDNDVFVKTMNCPYTMRWDNLEATNTNSRKCTNCEHFILDTAALTDENLLEIVRQNPATCLKIDLNQHNINIIANGIIGEK